jgi:lipopolysaccharide transport system ATP-binding protein
MNNGFGDVETVTNKYVHDGVIANNKFRPNGAAKPNDYIELIEFDVLPASGSVITVESGIRFSLLFRNKKAGTNLDATFFVFSLDDTCLFETGCIISKNYDSKEGTYKVCGVIPSFTLNAGSYKVNLIFGENQAYVIWKMNDIVSFEIENTLSDRGLNLNIPPGYLRPKVEWEFGLI